MSRPPRWRRTAALVLALAMAVLSGVGTRSQQPTFSSAVNAVRVDVLVTQKGQPVRGLARDDFEVLDNGVRQQIDLVSFEQMPVNVVLALDSSDSVKGERLEHLQAAGRAIIGALGASDQAALLTFDQKVRLGSPLTADFAGIAKAIERITPHGNTVLFDATYAGIVLAESDVGRSLLIVFTDGADTGSFLKRAAVVETSARTEVVVYGATVTLRGRPAFLKDVVEQTGGNVIDVDSTKELPATFLRILDEFRHRYLLSYSPIGVTKAGWHTLEVRVKGRGRQVKARRGYFAEK